MSNETTILTEEEMKAVSAVAEDEVKDNEKVSKIREIENTETVNDNTEIEEGIMGDDGLDFSDDDFKGVDLYEASMKAMQDDAIYGTKVTQEVADKMNIPIADMTIMFDIAKHYRAKEKFSVYNALPESVKEIVVKQILESGIPVDHNSRSLYCDLLMDQFISEFVDKQLDSEIVDFNKSIQETLGSITNITDIYAGHIRYMMEVELVKKAEATDNEEAKKIYLGCSDAFKDSYKFTRMINLINAGGKVRRKLYKENFKFKSLCAELDYKNKDTKFSIRNIEQMYDGLMQHVAPELGLDEDDCKAFVILFIKTTDNLDMNNIMNSLYVYYSIFNIINLGFDTNKSKFYHVIINNIKKVFNAMWLNIPGSAKVHTLYEIADDIDWTDGDLVSDEDIKAFDTSISEDTEA